MTAIFFVLLGAVLLLGAIAAKPIRALWKLVLNSLLGVILLLLFNTLAQTLHFARLPVNLLTILLTGILGVPGLILLLCFQVLMGNL